MPRMLTLLCSGAAYVGLWSRPSSRDLSAPDPSGSRAQSSCRLLRAEENKLFTGNSGSGGLQSPTGRGSGTSHNISWAGLPIPMAGLQVYIPCLACVGLSESMPRFVPFLSHRVCSLLRASCTSNMDMFVFL